jgi:hypothetical protein
MLSGGRQSPQLSREGEPCAQTRRNQSRESSSDRRAYPGDRAWLSSCRDCHRTHAGSCGESPRSRAIQAPRIASRHAPRIDSPQAIDLNWARELPPQALTALLVRPQSGSHLTLKRAAGCRAGALARKTLPQGRAVLGRAGFQSSATDCFLWLCFFD